MSCIVSTIFAAMIGLGAAWLSGVSGQASNLSANSDYSDPRICGNASVLNRITSQLSHQVCYVPSLLQVAIIDF